MTTTVIMETCMFNFERTEMFCFACGKISTHLKSISHAVECEHCKTKHRDLALWLYEERRYWYWNWLMIGGFVLNVTLTAQALYDMSLFLSLWCGFFTWLSVKHARRAFRDMFRRRYWERVIRLAKRHFGSQTQTAPMP